jgi:hypothetical protein
MLMDEELTQLHLTYARAMDEHSDASSTIYDSIRDGGLPTDEEMARKKVAHVALVAARREFWKALKRKHPPPSP